MKTNTSDKTVKLVLTGLMTALVAIFVMILPIPIPMTTGYVNFGDGVIFLSVMILGWKYGAFAGGVGAAMADILLGAAAWAPWTLVIKAGMAAILGLLLKADAKSAKFIGMALATVFMAAGYYIAEGVMYGNWLAPVAGVPWNLLQGAVGAVVATTLSMALKNRRLK